MTSASHLFDTQPQPRDPWSHLAAAVVLDAWKAVRSRSTVKSLDAALFLTGPDFELWADVLDLDVEAGTRLLTSGNWRQR